MKLTLKARIRLIKESGLFDAAWYLGEYPDVAMTGLDPIEHYARIGFKLKRDPSPVFSTERIARIFSEEGLLPKGHDPLSLYAKAVQKRVDAHGGAYSDLLQRGLALLKEKNYREFYLLRSILRDANAPERESVGHFLDAMLFSQVRAFSASLEKVRMLLGDADAQRRLSAAQRQQLQVLEARLLGRLGLIDEAVEKIKSLSGDKVDARLTGAYVDIVWRKQPDVAGELLAKLASQKRLPSFGYRILNFCLRADTLPIDVVQGEALEMLDKTDSTERRSELFLLLANLAGKKGEWMEQRGYFQEFWKAFDLPAPELGPDAPLRLGKIINAPRELFQEGPLVSVVMTTFNSASTVAMSVESLLAQSHGHFELIIVDDGSTDETREILSALAEGDARLRLFFNAINVGTYNSKNRGIFASRGDFITCHDSDDWAHPLRLETHLAAMAAHPGVMASRSTWVRIDEEGNFMLTRWAKTFRHDNPASTFIRRAVFERVGLFDSVRVGADSEMWTRIISSFGSAAVLSLPLPLSLGLRHESSLTTSGVAGLDEEQYSPVRDQYASDWVRWHQRACLEDELFLPNQEVREFEAPMEITPASLGEYLAGYAGGEASGLGLRKPRRRDPAVPEFVFAIPLAAATVGDWEHTCQMLGHTLRSILNQSNASFRVLLCGHDRPDLRELEDSRVEWMVSDIDPPVGSGKYRPDKARKRALIAHRFRQLGGGYYMPLDADDLVHRDLVAHVRETRSPHGYSLRRGYAMDWKNRKLAPVPGVWDTTFDQVCGSSGIFHFQPTDLPETLGKGTDEAYFHQFSFHAYWRTTAHENGRPLEDVDFPAVIYVLNHAQNLSFSLQRGALRQENLCRFIAERAIDATGDIEKAFALPAGFLSLDTVTSP